MKNIGHGKMGDMVVKYGRISAKLYETSLSRRLRALASA